MKKSYIISLIIGIFLLSMTFVNALSLFPRDITRPGDSISYNFSLISSGSSCESNVILSTIQLINLDLSGVGFYNWDISGVGSVIPSRICVRKEGVLIANLSFSDILFNSIRVNQIYANTINTTNLTVNGIEVCLKTGVNCPAGFTDTKWITNGYLYNDTNTIYFNETKLNNTIDARFGAGANASWNQSLADTLYAKYQFVNNNFNGSGNITTTGNGQFQLTTTGQLIMNGLITSQNITPITDNLYSIGNSTNWFKELFVKTINANSINTTNLTANDISSGKVNTTNLTVGGFQVYKDGGGDLNIDLD